ncbi:7598_t:CDS:2 [Acaulospora morrowiae]|uniref:7598_t:CDS:1 n=1 Tax=Acaulospora morrowiae TaxID=94023 RepID=A0A9N9B298_9GLOM|nr:7598_t:CDS:2 [Acaulospora morrowiae]
MERYNVSTVFDKNELGAPDTKFQWRVSQPIKTRSSDAESDSESEEESRQLRCHWLFEKSENKKGKVVPESTMMKKGYLKTKVNSQAQESDIESHPIVSDVDERLIEEPIMSRDSVQEEEIEKVETGSKLRNVQNGQIKTTLVEEPDTLILNEELPVIATTRRNQDRTDEIENDQETVKELARELPEDQQGVPIEIVQGLIFADVMLCTDNTDSVSV